jgi:hypothetical protein
MLQIGQGLEEEGDLRPRMALIKHQSPLRKAEGVEEMNCTTMYNNTNHTQFKNKQQGNR